MESVNEGVTQLPFGLVEVRGEGARRQPPARTLLVVQVRVVCWPSTIFAGSAANVAITGLALAGGVEETAMLRGLLVVDPILFRHVTE